MEEPHTLHSNALLLEIQSIMTVKQHIILYCLILGLGGVVEVEIEIEIISQLGTISINFTFDQNFHCSRPA